MPISANPSADPTRPPFLLGKLTVSPADRHIRYAGKLQNCEPKVFDLLLYFCKRQGEIVTREQLLSEVWEGGVVSDNAINRKIYQLRKLFGELDPAQEYLETIPKFGYRLVQPVSPINDDNGLGLRKWYRLGSMATTLVFLFLIYSLYLAQHGPDVAQVRQLTAIQGVESDASISPDGQWLLYSHANQGQPYRLQLKNLQSGQVTALTDTAAHDVRASWHPEGKLIAFARIKPGEPRQCRLMLMKMDKPPYSAKAVGECHAAHLPVLAFGASAQRLFIAERAQKTQPFMVNALDMATGHKHQLTLPPQNTNLSGDYFIRRNHNGEKLAILRYLGSNKVQVSVYNSQPFELQHQFELNAHINDIAWHPDEKWFYYRENRHIIETDNRGQSHIKRFHLGQPFDGLSMSADGKLLTLATRVSDTDIWSADIANTGQAAVLTGSTRQDGRPGFANSSHAMAFVSDRSGSRAIWLRKADGTLSQLTPDDMDVGFTYLSWSPDDRFILYEHKDEIYALEVATGQQSKLLGNENKAYVANWSADGTKLLFSSTLSGDWQLWSKDLQTGALKQLTNNGGYRGFDNPENGNLYFSKYHQDGLWQLTPDGKESQLLAEFSLLNWLNWRLIDGQVYYWQMGEQAGIYRYTLKRAQ